MCDMNQVLNINKCDIQLLNVFVYHSFNSNEHFIPITPTVHIQEFLGSKEASQKLLVAFNSHYMNWMTFLPNAEHRDTTLGKQSPSEHFTKVEAKQLL